MALAVVRSRLVSFDLAGIVARRPPLLREFSAQGRMAAPTVVTRR